MPRACSQFLGPFIAGEVARAFIKKVMEKEELFSENLLFLLSLPCLLIMQSKFNRSRSRIQYFAINKVRSEVSSIPNVTATVSHCHFVICFLTVRAMPCKFDPARPGNLI